MKWNLWLFYIGLSMQMGLVILSGQARMLGESRQLTHHKSSPILPGEPRRTSPLPLRRNRTALVVFCGRIELPNSPEPAEQIYHLPLKPPPEEEPPRKPLSKEELLDRILTV